ncbi:MAG: PHP domain-containing protein [Chthoniobacterales bacterium]|jgi:predicted metal-dependent phosphoesterase TrpH|nr:PHP domain-containing protein [Chthoniobacterales bacterium]
MPLRIDLHVHSFFSMDGVSSPEDLIAAARAAGLNGFAITDHNTCDAVDYMIERGLMREDGRPVDGFLVIPGVEVTTADGHLLSIGCRLPSSLKGMSPIEVCHLAHRAGGICVAPHPYDLFRAGIRESVLDTLPLDGLEVFNAATTLKRHNRKAYQYAEKRGLPMTAGSDAHHAAAVGVACTILEADDFSVAGVMAALKRGSELEQQYLSTRQTIRKTWNNWFRLRGKTRGARATREK